MSERSEAADWLFEEALLAFKTREYQKAEGFLADAIRIVPDFVEAWVMRGTARMASEAWFDAQLHYKEALSLDPGLNDAWNNRGKALMNLQRWEEAELCLRRSYEISPAIDPCVNLAALYGTLNRLAEAEVEQRKALTHGSNLDVVTGLGLLLLGQKKWKEGFFYFSARHADAPYLGRSRRIHKNLDVGEPIEGKTILVYGEQGLGDEIAFMRFATEVKRRGAKRVILEVMPTLLRLARTVEGVDEVAVRNTTSPLGVDYGCSIMDVPMALAIEADDIPSPWSYLSVDENIAVPPLPTGFNVGLCWQAGKRPLQPETNATSINKSVRLDLFEPLTKMGLNLISLQKINSDERLSREYGIIDYMPKVIDMADTAALIQKLDLVISVDTSVAHLAGALGKPVWNLVRFDGSWPWMDAWRDTRWYPSMRVYRQPRPFDWWEPMKRLYVDLEALLQQQQRKVA